MKAFELQAYLTSMDSGWEYPADTVDTFKAGDPEADITGIAVGWMAYRWALERAIALSCNVFLTHEPTYFNHYDTEDEILRFAAVREKREFIQRENLVIIRCHDLWDRLEGLGIPDSWGRFLDLGEAIDGDAFTRVYRGGGRTARDFARLIARKVRTFGQEAVQLIGPAERVVEGVAIGTGAITPFLEWVQAYDIDLAICSEDGIEYWRDGAYALEMGIPIIVVNHPVTEEAGIMSMADHLRRKFPEIPVHHIPQTCMVQLISPSS